MKSLGVQGERKMEGFVKGTAVEKEKKPVESSSTTEQLFYFF